MTSKGIVLAGGTGSRLHPLTLATSKQLLPVYDKPMVYYPLTVLMLAGIRDILVITRPGDQPAFFRLLGDGSQWGIRLEYASQPEPDGIAQAFLIGEEFLDGQGCALVLGDNLFYGGGMHRLLREAAAGDGGRIFVKQVPDPERYGVVTIDEEGAVTDIVEKPTVPASKWAVAGLYFYDHRIVDIASSLAPSERGELEITTVNRAYLDAGDLKAMRMGQGIAWLDTGTFASLVEAAEFVRVLETRQRLKVGAPEEVAYEMGYIDAEQLRSLAGPLMASGYGQSLLDLADDDPTIG